MDTITTPEPSAGRADRPPSHATPAAARWTTERVVRWFILGGVTAFLLWRIAPDQIFRATTPTGGDLGAHVWGPAYLRDHLLPLRLSGWSPDWFAGFPAYRFYMVVPALAVAILDVVLPYGVALKLVIASSVIAMPWCAYAAARMMNVKFPGPELAALGVVPFLFDTAPMVNIYGGNFGSTLSGEYAYGISLCFAILAIGIASRGLQTGRHRALLAIVFAACVLSHIIPAFFATGGILIVLLFRLDRERLKWIVPVVATAGALTAFWTLPFVANHAWFNDMGWVKIPTDFSDPLKSPLFSPQMRVALPFAVFAVLMGMVERRRAPLQMAAIALALAVAFVALPEAALWNARLLPCFYVSVWMLAGFGVAAFGRTLALLAVESLPDSEAAAPRVALAATVGVGLAMMLVTIAAAFSWAPPSVTASLVWSLVRWIFVIGGLGAVGWIGYRLVMSGAHGRGAQAAVESLRALFAVVAMVVVLAVVSGPLGILPNWAPLRPDPNDYSARSWLSYAPAGSFGGYESQPGWPAYQNFNVTMARVGKENGCGRAMWEFSQDLGRYGTTMAPMLLPYWTNGCIGSMEGLYFESSKTTPFHFLNQARLSEKPSSPQRDLAYQALDVGVGVGQLRALGVRYYLASSPAAQTAADQQPDLRLITTISESPDGSPTWKIYEVQDTAIVYAPSVLPAVYNGPDDWRSVAEQWFQRPSAWAVPLAQGGPKAWPRTASFSGPAVPVTPAVVSDVKVTRDRVSFRVDRPGTPVIVRVSAFPNWTVQGADGWWVSAPNMMVVVPTQRNVTLYYAASPLDLVASTITVFGLAGIAWFALAPVPAFTRRKQWWRDDEYDPEEDDE